MVSVRRGEIWLAELPTMGNSVQAGCRPVLIISNDKNNRFSPTVNVVAVTSKIKKETLPVHTIVEKGESGLDYKSMIMAEQMLTVSKDIIHTKIGEVSDSIMEQVNKSIMVQLGM